MRLTLRNCLALNLKETSALLSTHTTLPTDPIGALQDFEEEFENPAAILGLVASSEEDSIHTNTGEGIVTLRDLASNFPGSLAKCFHLPMATTSI